MSNGNLALARAFVLTACMVASGGCDIGAAHSEESRTPEVRYRIDSARNRIWVLTHDGVMLYDITAPKTIAISLPEWVQAGKAYACLPDLALGPRGEAVITSNAVPTLWRIHPETLAVTVHPLALDADTDKDVGFSGLAYSAQHAAFFAVSYAHGSLWRIDPLFERAQKIELSEPVRSACGLAVRPRATQPSRAAQEGIRRPDGLCVRTAQEVLDLDFAPNQRSAHVTARVRAGVRFPPFNHAGHEPCG